MQVKIKWIAAVLSAVVVVGCAAEPVVGSVPETSASANADDPTATTSADSPTTVTESSHAAATAPDSSAFSHPTTDSLQSTTAPTSDVNETPILPTAYEPIAESSLSPQEAADRQAIEATWRQAWVLYETVQRIPPEERESRLSSVMVDPIKSELVTDAAFFNENNLDTYGTINLYPFWYRPVMGGASAVIGDCRDSSEFGSLYLSTNEKRTVGTANALTVGHFIRTSDGWRLTQVYFLSSIPCAP